MYRVSRATRRLCPCVRRCPSAANWWRSRAAAVALRARSKRARLAACTPGRAREGSAVCPRTARRSRCMHSCTAEECAGTRSCTNWCTQPEVGTVSLVIHYHYINAVVSISVCWRLYFCCMNISGTIYKHHSFQTVGGGSAIGHLIILSLQFLALYYFLFIYNKCVVSVIPESVSLFVL